MSVRTIYKCDKCGKEQETHEQFWKVGVVAYPFTGTLNTYSPFVTREHEQQVCRPCLESYGLFVQTRNKEAATQSAPTLEDLIIELVHETVDSRD